MTAVTHSRSASHTFAPVDTTLQPCSKDDVESPSLSDPSCLARFEFESGRSGDGTKILMIEWEDDSITRETPGSWHISWEGKNTVLPAGENLDGANTSTMHRMYFLLPPGVSVPGTVLLIYRPQDKSRKVITWKTNPLPAIFPPELGASARAAGKKGVLHTIWAKKRLQELQHEIAIESRVNVEGVALTMAIQEKEWIEQNFGVTAKPANLNISHALGGLTTGEGLPLSPMTPRTPGGGRLMEKLRGLKLGTSDRELLPSPVPGSALSDATPTEQPQSNPLSPEISDVAVSSFAAFKGANPSMLAAKPPQPSSTAPQPRKVTGQEPPPTVRAQQLQTENLGSLNAISAPPSAMLRSAGPKSSAPVTAVNKLQDEEGLFALPISPRSPDMTKSPFSFKASDTIRYMKEEKV